MPEAMVCRIMIYEYLLTLNNNGLNDSFSIFRHGGICFESYTSTGN